MPGTSEVTALLEQVGRGHGSAIDRLLPLVYDEMKSLAEHHLRGERAHHTLQPTALVHEAYIKLVRQTRVRWRDRAHFFAVAAQAIRRILIDHARTRNRRKRMGTRTRIPFTNTLPVFEEASDDLIALDEALLKLASQAPRKAQVVEMRFFGGLTTEEVAAVLGINARSAERDWQYARAWLFRELDGCNGESTGAATDET